MPRDAQPERTRRLRTASAQLNRGVCPFCSRFIGIGRPVARHFMGCGVQARDVMVVIDEAVDQGGARG